MPTPRRRPVRASRGVCRWPRRCGHRPVPAPGSPTRCTAFPPSELRSAVTPTAPTVAPLASFLVRSGALKGKRFPVKVPIVNIGRADYNDIVLADPSVSTSHAKLQRRDDIWVLSDAGSTNGTFVDDERATGEVALGPGRDAPLRRGLGVVGTLRPSGRQARAGDPAGRARRHAAPTAPSGRCRQRRRRPIHPPASAARRVPAWVLGVLGIAVLAIAYFLLLR